MRKNPLNKGIIMENAAGIGTVTSEMIQARARELAAINGRPSSKPSETDYQQAKRELTVMIPRAETPWIAAAHRFAEVSLGILTALAVVGVWREESRLFENTTAK